MALKRANPPSVNRRGSPISTSSSATDRVSRPQSSASVEPLVAHELVELCDDLLLLAVQRGDLRAVAVEHLQAQGGRRVVAPAAVAALERGEPGPHGLGGGQLLAQLQRQLTQQMLGLVDQVLAAGQDRPAPVVPQRQQLVLLIRAAVATRTLERLGQQRVREHLARDPLGVQRVGLAALARAIMTRGVRFAQTSRTS